MNDDYLALLNRIERVRNSILVALETELKSKGMRDLNATQALMMATLGPQEINIRRLYNNIYFRTNVSHNLHKLNRMGYLELKSDEQDRRLTFVSLSKKGKDAVRMISEILSHHKKSLSKNNDLNELNDSLVVLGDFFESLVK